MEKSIHFDTDALDVLAEVMEEEFPDLIQVYLADSEPRIEAMRTALLAADHNALRELAHSFKGASSNLSAMPLSELCYTIERAGRDKVLDGVSDQIDAVEHEFASVKAILSSMI